MQNRKEVKRRHYLKYKEEILKEHAEWYIKNKENRREYNKRYYEEHKNEIQKRSRVWRKEYCRKFPEKIKEQSKRNYKKWVNSCSGKRVKRRQRRQYWIAWSHWFRDKGLDVCSKCGYNEHFCAIDFHHIGPKKFEICGKLGRKITPESERILVEELKQCIPLCSNCHRITHFENNSARNTDGVSSIVSCE